MYMTMNYRTKYSFFALTSKMEMDRKRTRSMDLSPSVLKLAPHGSRTALNLVTSKPELGIRIKTSNHEFLNK